MSDPEWVIYPFLAEDYGLRLGSTDSHPVYFTLQTTVVHSGSLETELKSCSVALTPHKPKLLLQQLLGLQYHLACWHLSAASHKLSSVGLSWGWWGYCHNRHQPPSVHSFLQQLQQLRCVTWSTQYPQAPSECLQTDLGQILTMHLHYTSGYSRSSSLPCHLINWQIWQLIRYPSLRMSKTYSFGSENFINTNLQLRSSRCTYTWTWWSLSTVTVVSMEVQQHKHHLGSDQEGHSSLSQSCPSECCSPPVGYWSPTLITSPREESKVQWNAIRHTNTCIMHWWLFF